MQHAPAPRKGNKGKAIYEVVASLGGASKADIRRYIKTTPGVSFTKSSLDKNLYNMVARGYLVKDETGKVTKWRIAPMEYYKAKRAKIKTYNRKCRAKSKPKAKAPVASKPVAKPVPANAGHYPRMTHWVSRETAITWALVTLIGGFGIGLAIGSLI